MLDRVQHTRRNSALPHVCGGPEVCRGLLKEKNSRPESACPGNNPTTEVLVEALASITGNADFV